MRTMHIETMRNDKSVFKKVDIPSHVHRLLLHFKGMAKPTKPFLLWDYKAEYIEQPKGSAKKWLMKLEVYILEPGEKEPIVETKLQKLKREFKIRKLKDPEVGLKVDKKVVKALQKDRK